MLPQKRQLTFNKRNCPSSNLFFSFFKFVLQRKRKHESFPNGKIPSLRTNLYGSSKQLFLPESFSPFQGTRQHLSTFTSLARKIPLSAPITCHPSPVLTVFVQRVQRQATQPSTLTPEKYVRMKISNSAEPEPRGQRSFPRDH